MDHLKDIGEKYYKNNRRNTNHYLSTILGKYIIHLLSYQTLSPGKISNEMAEKKCLRAVVLSLQKWMHGKMLSLRNI